MEEGIVVKVEGTGKASVEFERTSSCGMCRACSKGAGGKMHIEADNRLGAKAGDRVQLDVKTRGLVFGIIMIYLLPAAGLLFGVVFGSKISDIMGILLGITLMLLFFMIARYYGRKIVSYSAEIVGIVKEVSEDTTPHPDTQ